MKLYIRNSMTVNGSEEVAMDVEIIFTDSFGRQKTLIDPGGYEVSGSN